MRTTANWEPYVSIMQKKMVSALGCTEPVAVALCTARARALLGEAVPLERIEISVSKSILKNAMGVTIPGTNLCGVNYAAALGATGGNYKRNLQVLESCTPQDLEDTLTLVKAGQVSVSLDRDAPPVYVKAAAYGGGHCGTAVIAGEHDRFVQLIRDGEVFLNLPVEHGADEEKEREAVLRDLSFRGVYSFATTAPLSCFELVVRSILLNRRISDDGLVHDYGLHLGKLLKEQLADGTPAQNLEERALMRTSAAIDARMSGSPLAVMANSGSGNQGITATIPVYSVACDIGADDEKTIRAVTLSHMTAIYIKQHLSSLSSLCGAIVAAIGAGCGIVYLLGGDFDAIERTVVNMIAAITGMICDGAKASCSLKVAAALQCCFNAVNLAMSGIRVTSIQGITGETAEETIDNLGRLNLYGMEQTDDVILDIMLEKQLEQTSK